MALPHISAPRRGDDSSMAPMDPKSSVIGPSRNEPGAFVARWSRRLLGVPLFYKILMANALIAALAGGGALLVGSRLGPEAWSLPVVAIFVLGLILMGVALNAGVVHLALSPIADLERTADRVRRGDLSARTEPSPVADERLDRLRVVLNEMLESIRTARERQHDLSLRVLQGEERERQRLADEIYSGIAQTLATVLVRLRIAARQGMLDPEELCEEVRGAVAEALEEVRAVARRLRPPELDELGVRAALEAHARHLGEGTGTAVRFSGDVSRNWLPPEASLALFRILQEAVTNAFRHARAKGIQVTFRPMREGLWAEVRDDGRGFDPALVSATGGGLGILGMQERARWVSGTLRIDSEPGCGSIVSVLLPWKEPAESGEDRTSAPTSAPVGPGAELALGTPPEPAFNASLRDTGRS